MSAALASRSNNADPPLRVQRWPWEKTVLYFSKNFNLNTQKGNAEHVATEGPNGSGKSVLMLALLQEVGATRKTKNGRPIPITILVDAPRDRTMSQLGWPIIRRLEDWPPGYGEEQVLVWPPYGTNLSTVADRQRAVFKPVLDEIYSSGNQIVYIDEVAYFAETKPNGLALSAELNHYWRQSRKLAVSLWGGTQRPVNVPRNMFTEPYWLFLFRPEDDEDLKTVADRSGQKELVREILPTLGAHEFLMLRRRPERIAVISQVEL